MRDTVEALLNLAREDLRAAHLTLDQGFVRVAISRAYYAAFHVAQAALLTVGEQPGTHAGVSNRFYVHFVETGRLPRDIGRLLPDALRQRNSADYDALTVFDTHAAADLIADVETFVQAVEVLISSTPDEAPLHA